MTKINHVDWEIVGPMDIRDLDYFLARCKAGSFAAVACDACIVQSAMSSAMARLEQDLGVQLFDRASCQ
jgi:DNA-binding transcriptional LysR family regulator